MRITNNLMLRELLHKPSKLLGRWYTKAAIVGGSGALLLTLVSNSFLGCGASYQAIYEGEVRFEHCYRLDEDPSVPLAQRKECWREWTQSYTYGQTRDRLEYALMRQRELSGKAGSSSADGGADPDGMGPVVAKLVAPAPTSLFEPPPAVFAVQKDAGPEAAIPEGGDGSMPSDLLGMLTSGPNLPGRECLVRCARNWESCSNACTDKIPKCKPRCDLGFRTCAGKCL